MNHERKAQSKPMFYNGMLYPSSRHLLLANLVLVTSGDIGKMIALLNQKARRAKARGETLGLSLDDVSVKFGIDKLRYVDEFDAWVDMVSERLGDAGMAEMFYCYQW